MEYFIELYLDSYSGNLRGFIFGFVHVGVMLLGYYSGWSINRFLKIISNGYIAGIVEKVNVKNIIILLYMTR